MLRKGAEKKGAWGQRLEVMGSLNTGSPEASPFFFLSALRMANGGCCIQADISIYKGSLTFTLAPFPINMLSSSSKNSQRNCKT